MSKEPNGCSDLTAYKQPQSPFEQNPDWSWNETAKAWEVNQPFPYPSGTYYYGVANRNAILKTGTIDYQQADNASDYCPPGSNSCLQANITQENLSTKGNLYLVLHMPVKKWLEGLHF